tara:strand:- start:2757 stop:3083 length:327 start_codon:yes stop_codon:yes gene_type:complete
MKNNYNEKKKLKMRLISLMDEVQEELKKEPDVDKFLDETKLFDEWEVCIAEEEFPIFIMAVLNNIRRESILETIISSIINSSETENQKFKQGKKPNYTRSHLGEQPFN